MGCSSLTVRSRAWCTPSSVKAGVVFHSFSSEWLCARVVLEARRYAFRILPSAGSAHLSRILGGVALRRSVVACSGPQGPGERIVDTVPAASLGAGQTCVLCR